MPQLLARALALIASLVLLPPMLVIALVLAVVGGRPILYRAPRVGYRGRTFEMLKFRTMRARGEGPAISTLGDPRVTKVGRWLRRHRLDELPQLWNVVRGEMLLVGPRPEDPRFVDLTDPRQMEILSVPPGITGPTQVRFRSEAELLGGPDPERYYRDHIVPEKLASDLAYVRTRSTVRDLLVLRDTLRTIMGA